MTSDRGRSPRPSGQPTGPSRTRAGRANPRAEKTFATCRLRGAGAPLLGLSGPVESKDYKAIHGPGGAADPDTRIRLANTKRPGMELVVSAHKSVAELGVIGRANDMHAILDAERDATLGYLDQLMSVRGGFRLTFVI